MYSLKYGFNDIDSFNTKGVVQTEENLGVTSFKFFNQDKSKHIVVGTVSFTYQRAITILMLIFRGEQFIKIQ